MPKENKYTKEDLKTMQSWDLDKKIQVTKTRIIEWYEHYNGQVYVSFSGGKDSTVLLNLVRSIYPDVEAVFVDTGLEYPEIREFVKTFNNVRWLKPDMNFRKVIEKYGYPVVGKTISRQLHDVKKLGENCYAYKCFNGEKTDLYDMRKWKYLIDAPFSISNECCTIMKKKPLKKIKDKQPMTAIMTSESIQRKNNWLKDGCNAFNNNHPISQPMSFWTEQDVLLYIKLNNIKYASVYGNIIETKGKLSMSNMQRTGCMFCMYGCHLEKSPNRFQRMAETHPTQYDWCMKDWEDGGLGLAKVLNYIGVDYKPRK